VDKHLQHHLHLTKHRCQPHHLMTMKTVFSESAVATVPTTTLLWSCGIRWIRCLNILRFWTNAEKNLETGIVKWDATMKMTPKWHILREMPNNFMWSQWQHSTSLLNNSQVQISFLSSETCNSCTFYDLWVHLAKSFISGIYDRKVISRPFPSGMSSRFCWQFDGDFKLLWYVYGKEIQYFYKTSIHNKKEEIPERLYFT
jgi:hypothetical protein